LISNSICLLNQAYELKLLKTAAKHLIKSIGLYVVVVNEEQEDFFSGFLKKYAAIDY